MKTINKLVILIIAFFCSGFSKDGTWIIASESKLAIHGLTNVNTFTCAIASYGKHDTLRYFNNHVTNEIQFATNRMAILIRKFDCGSRQISRDFNSTLMSDVYPYLEIRFVTLEANQIKMDSPVAGIVDITLAGITKRYKILFSISHVKGTVLLSGHHPVYFTDFKLRPPQKLMGMIHVKDQLDVEFDLVLKPQLVVP